MADIFLNIDFPTYLHGCKTGIVVAQWDEDTNTELGCDFIPLTWNIDRGRLSNKIEELLSEDWRTKVKTGFIETLNTALRNE